jgi:L-threonylcarbamoyladenylate synthase
LNKWHLWKAAYAVKNNGVIAYPTEAVFGLGCSPWDNEALIKLAQLKQRKLDKGFIIIAANLVQLESLVDFDEVHSIQEILASWPGPVTWVLPARAHVPSTLRGRNGGLAVRVSAHPLVQGLCKACGPLVSTSANISNTRPARSPLQVRNYFQDKLNYILPGKLGSEHRPSEIRHGSSGEILRQG